MNIDGQIKGIKYEILLSKVLKLLDINELNINKSPASFLLSDQKHTIAISKWVSPKRTRSYPYERVYNTLNSPKKITIIPIIKDEGIDGDRDYIQWDTVSLMSLLDVFVIFGYYHKAIKNQKYDNKITGFQYNNNYIISKIREIKQYYSSALHWNLNEITVNFSNIVRQAKESYQKIENQTGVRLHSLAGIDNFLKNIEKDASGFIDFSRDKARKAQSREIITKQPKESLQSATKAKLTIKNFLGGQYFLTVDEVLVENKVLFLIESKHTRTNLLPSIGDIKDGLLKMILFSNLNDVRLNDVKKNYKALLYLTSSRLINNLKSDDSTKDKKQFFKDNNFSPSECLLIESIFKEANINNFIIKIGYSK